MCKLYHIFQSIYDSVEKLSNFEVGNNLFTRFNQLKNPKTLILSLADINLDLPECMNG